jgi:hypothetical protein
MTDEATRRCYVREKGVINHLARKLFKPPPEPAAETSDHPKSTTNTGLPVAGLGSGPRGVGPGQGRAADISGIELPPLRAGFRQSLGKPGTWAVGDLRARSGIRDCSRFGQLARKQIVPPRGFAPIRKPKSYRNPRSTRSG